MYVFPYWNITVSLVNTVVTLNVMFVHHEVLSDKQS